MTGRRTLAAGVVLLILAVSQHPASGQMRERGDRGPAAVPRIAAVLEDAGYPLTPEQAAAIEALRQGERQPDAFAEILTDEQEAALAGARRQQAENQRQRNQELRERIRNQEDRVRQLRERTGEQGERLREPGPAVRERMIDRIASVLEEAGQPLTPEQRERLSEQDPANRPNLADILTDEQEAALRESRQAPDARVRIRTDAPGMRGRGIRGYQPPEDFERPVRPGMGAGAAAKDAGTVLRQELVTGIRQNFPNPFNPATAIEYSLGKPGDVRIEIYNSAGQRIESLVNGYREAGIHTVIWDASNQANGIYFCRITTADVQETRKMLLVK